MRRFILTAVTDSTLLPHGEDIEDRIRSLCSLGVRRIVLREKGMPSSDYAVLAERFVRICRESCTIPVISHHTDIAKMTAVDEFQVSIDELREDPSIVNEFRRVCVSVHSADEAVEAESLGASSVTAGHVFDTECKRGTPGRGLEFLKGVVDMVNIPVYAIGGIDQDVIDRVYGAGASGVCLMSTMMSSSEDPISSLVRRCFDITRPVFNKGCLALYAVTDSRWLREGESIVSEVEKAILGGATIVQLREKDRERLKRDAGRCLSVCRSYGVPLIINDDVDLAIEIGADGVHLGQEDMSASEASAIFGGIIGVSAHNVGEATKAKEDGADYIGCGAVFPTSTKDNTSALGLDGLKKITSEVSIPAVAIGGIDENNISMLEGSGISGVAVVSAIFAKGDTERAAKDMRKKVSSILSSGHSNKV